MQKTRSNTSRDDAPDLRSGTVVLTLAMLCCAVAIAIVLGIAMTAA